MIPKARCAPPRETRKPVTTSSKTRMMPFLAVASRSASRNSRLCGTVPKPEPVGSMMAAAMSSSPSIAARIAAMSPGGSKIALVAISGRTPGVGVPSKCEVWPAVM